MWAQIVKVRMKPEAEQHRAELIGNMRDRIGRRPGIVNGFVMANQHDEREFYIMTVYESEEKAREGEAALATDESFQRERAMMGGAPEFVDLTVYESVT
jgi:heme-degrading monooxygenase HmoA